MFLGVFLDLVVEMIEGSVKFVMCIGCEVYVYVLKVFLFVSAFACAFGEGVFEVFVEFNVLVLYVSVLYREIVCELGVVCVVLGECEWVY